MQIPFDTPARKWLVASVAAVLAVAYVGFAATIFLGAWFGGRLELSSLQRAVRLDPTSADYWDHLGRYREFVGRDPGAAIGPYSTAVRLNPHSARYWFDLASAYQVRGDVAHQTLALERAIEADPTTPDVAWEAANLYLVQGQNEKALREFRVVMANDVSLISPSLQFCWHLEPDVNALLRDVVPARSETLLPFLVLLMSKQETAATAKVWDALIQSGQPFERHNMFEYFTYLIRHQAVDEAVLVWRQGTSRFGLGSYLPSSSNLMVNGNFSLNVLNAGFDWQYQKQNSVELTLDPRDFHGGHRSLFISFDGPRVEDAGIFQYVPVQPNTAYEISAYYKSADLEGAGGPHLTVQDMYDPKTIYYDSDDMNEAGFWKSVGGEFTTNPDCNLVVVHIRRVPVGAPIRGKLWVDDFRLAKK